MSVHALACVLGDGRRDGNPSKSTSEGSARLVLLAIANYANDYGMCWPKVAELAPAANVHRGTVNRNLDELIRLGELRMFKRGHYQSPAFVMTIVDHPLSTQDIVERLVELDDRAEWRERMIDRATGEAIEEPVPGQGSLPLTRLSQIATISQNDTAVSIPDGPKSSDQGLHGDQARENLHNRPSEEIVADRDNLGEIVASRAEIVADGAEIVAMARRSSEPSGNHQGTARSSSHPNFIDLVAAARGELTDLATRKARARGAHNVGALTRTILTQDHDLLAAELVESKTAAARGRAIADCPACDTRGFAWTTPDGDPVPPDHADAETAGVCDHRRGGGRHIDVSPGATTGAGSPPGPLPCVGCDQPSDTIIIDLAACLACTELALKEARP